MLDDPFDKAIFFISAGCVGTIVAVFRPKWLSGIRGWFYVYKASRFGLIVGSVGCILIGLRELSIIPQRVFAYLLMAWILAVGLAFLHDIAMSSHDDET